MTVVRFVLIGRDAGQTKKTLRPRPEGLRAPLSVGRVAGLGVCFRARRRRRHFGFGAAEPTHGVCAHAPEDGDLRGLGLLGLAILTLVLRANEQAVHEDVIALVESLRDGLAEAVEGISYVESD